MKIRLSELRKIIQEEASAVILERKLVREEARKIVNEILPKLGTGKRFNNLVKKLSAKENSMNECLICKEGMDPQNFTQSKICQGCKDQMKHDGIVDEEYHVHDPKALAAWIGRRKLGKEKFQQLAAAGKHHHHG